MVETTTNRLCSTPRLKTRSWQSARFVAALALAGWKPLCAQDSIATVLGRLNPGQVVRVRLEDQRRVVGRILETRNAAPGLLLEGVDSPLPAHAIDTLWVRGRATKHGAIIGAAVGGVSSFAAAALICEAVSEGNGCDVWGTVTAIGLGGAAGGALLGAAVGAAVPRWHRRYARPTAPVRAGLMLHRGVGLAVLVRF